ncbi:MAG: hypothetical protein IKD35_04155, partial [Clostridia bacterium]|nr:hypothetical protein [Clostridia bacterium]
CCYATEPGVPADAWLSLSKLKCLTIIRIPEDAPKTTENSVVFTLSQVFGCYHTCCYATEPGVPADAWLLLNKLKRPTIIRIPEDAPKTTESSVVFTLS